MAELGLGGKAWVVITTVITMMALTF